MHMLICVLVPKDIPYEEQESIIEKLMDPYDVNVEVPAYKKYVSKERQADIAKHFKIDGENKQEIAEKIEDWDGNKGGVDGKDVFEIVTVSPQARLDAWAIEEFVPIEKLIETEDIYEQMIVPDGRWVDFNTLKDFSKTYHKGNVSWGDVFLAILEKHVDSHIAAIVWGDS